MKTGEKVASFLPAKLVSWIEEGKLVHHFPAIVAFADASGFTAMSEKLAAMGREGAETLTSILNSYFTAMISRIERNGGFVGKFGGDAMTIFFPAENKSDLPEVAKRAVATSLELQSAMEEFQNLETRGGTFSLGMKVGVAAGDVLFKVVGPEEIGREFLLAGIPLDRAADAEHHGTSGEIILTPLVSELCGDCGGEVLEDGFVKLTLENEPPVYDKYISTTDQFRESWAELAKAFIDPPVYNRVKLGLDSVGEIRRVSVIFMSFSGLDYDEDSEVTEKLDVVYNWVYGLTQKYNASINKVDMGDKGSKMILTFGTPIAHENSEQHAVYCGLELMKGKEELSKWGLQWKLGISTGVVFAGEVGAPSRQEYTVMGSTVNLSARLMAKSEPGHMLVDEATHKRSLDFFEYSEPIKHQFKGISEQLPTWEPLGVKKAEPHKELGHFKPLIGRESEVETISEILDEVAESKLKILVISGSAGTGKSRLSQETLLMSDKKDFVSGGGEALSYAKQSPYLVWISVLRGLMGLTATSSEEENLTHLEEIIHSADPQNTFRTPIIANLLGISCPENDVIRQFDGKLRQENMYDFLLQYFKYLTKNNPVALFFEDMQWIDKNSLELIAYLQHNLKDDPLFFVLVRRPYGKGFTSPHIETIEGSEDTTHVNVSEFDRDTTEKFVLSCLNANSVDEDLIEFVFDASHGNASFTEELINNLKSIKKIKLSVDPSDSSIKAEKTGDLSDVEVPDSLNSLIMSQLDRLGTEAKLTVKIAAVIGRRFSDEVVKEAYPVDIDPDVILQSVKELSIHDMINSSEDVEFFNYIFKNILTRDVAYDSLLFAHRRDYHNRVGLCLEKMHDDEAEKWCEELGRHFYQSEDDERAIKYLIMSGKKSFKLFANESAITYYTRALDRATKEHHADDRFYLLSQRAKIHDILGRYEEFKEGLDEALEIARSVSNIKGMVNTLRNLSRYYQLRNELDEMKSLVEEGLNLVKQIDHPFGFINLSERMGASFFLQNKPKEGLEWFEKSLNEAKRVNDTSGLVVALTQCGLAYKALGDLDKALEHYNSSVEISRENQYKKSEAMNLGNIGVLYHQRGEFDQALEIYQEALEIGRSIGWKEIQTRNLGNLAVLYQRQGELKIALDTYQEKLAIERMMNNRKGELITLGNIGMWYAQDGDYDTAISYYQQALEIATELGLKAEEPRQLMNIGQSFQRRGELDKAKEILEEAVKKSAEIGYKMAEDYARRYLGFVLIELGELEQAEREFSAAREIATEIGDKIGVVSTEVGDGWIEMLRTDNREALEEAIENAKKAKDPETFLIGQMALVKILIDRDDDKDEIIELLKFALEIAKRAGMRRDVKVIEPMLEQLTGESSSMK